MKIDNRKFRTKEEVKYLLDEIQDRLESLEIKYKENRKALFASAEEIRNQEMEK